MGLRRGAGCCRGWGHRGTGHPFPAGHCRKMRYFLPNIVKPGAHWTREHDARARRPCWAYRTDVRQCTRPQGAITDRRDAVALVLADEHPRAHRGRRQDDQA